MSNSWLITTTRAIPKRRKKVLTGEIATRARQIFAELAIEKGWDILALEVDPDPR